MPLSLRHDAETRYAYVVIFTPPRRYAFFAIIFCCFTIYHTLYLMLSIMLPLTLYFHASSCRVLDARSDAAYAWRYFIADILYAAGYFFFKAFTPLLPVARSP